MEDNILQTLLTRAQDYLQNIDMYIGQVVERYPNEVMNMLYQQMQEGQGANGEFRPSYSQDPWFRSAEKANNYAQWKSRINPNPARDSDTPDLYIDGTFYSEIGVRFGTFELEYYPETSYAAEIMNKYGRDQFDLNQKYRDELGRIIAPDVERQFEELMIF